MAAYWEMGSKLSVMIIILFVSLFAVSFPTLSKQIPYLRIHPIIFFIGKHFGTGVILATAFLHLLDDAFKSLQDPVVSRKYGHVGKWTGLIILGSLLAIFLVEYISTIYVNHLQGKPSAPPTPVSSRNGSPSPPPSPPRSVIPPIKQVTSKKKRRSSNASRTSSQGETGAFQGPNETTPLLVASRPVNPNKPLTSPSHDAEFLAVAPQPKRGLTIPLDPSGGSLLAAPPSDSRSRSPPRPSRRTTRHHLHGPIIPVAAVAGVPIEVLTNSPRIFRLGLSHDHHHHHHHHHHHNEEGHHSVKAHSVHEPDDAVQPDEPDHDHHHDHHHHHHVMVGRRRQIVGILVLQLGIMIHSLVIGLTLAVTYGTEFTSLTTAIVFHQLFEGLSLGIRIAALPAPPGQTSGTDEVQSHSHKRRGSEGSDTVDRGRSKVAAWGHNGSPDEHRGYGAISSTPKPPSPLSHDLSKTTTNATSLSTDTTSTTITSSTHVSSTSSGSCSSGTAAVGVPSSPVNKGKACAHGYRGRHRSGWSLAGCKEWIARKWAEIHWLKPTLSVLFAITTPLGMAIGMWIWGAQSDSKSPDMLLTQGVMSAISAGLLIYAATVEMIAGDFVFGDVEGGHHHHHHEEGGEQLSFVSPPAQEGPLLDEEEVLGKLMAERFREMQTGCGPSSDIEGGSSARTQMRGTVQIAPPEKHESSVMKKVLAVVSMFAGVAGMVLVGLGE
ncbi:ZIP zinc transporter-domain-containing protein [Panaeolus papilionaceus]|nr:ZIP zinc transporter-domain-containing protein [Panaeolus papilionaceus]